MFTIIINSPASYNTLNQTVASIFTATYLQVLCATQTSEVILNTLLTVALLFIEKSPVFFFFPTSNRK